MTERYPDRLCRSVPAFRIQGEDRAAYRRCEIRNMGFNRRKMRAQRAAGAEKEAGREARDLAQVVIYRSGPHKLRSRSARKTLLYRLAIHCRPLDVTLRYLIAA